MDDEVFQKMKDIWTKYIVYYGYIMPHAQILLSVYSICLKSHAFITNSQ